MSKVFAAFWLVLSLSGASAFCAVQPREWHAESGFRWTSLQLPAQGKTGFAQMAPSQTGLDFTNVLLEFSGATNRILYNGAGVALGDFDNDGWLDIFACGLDSPSALYRNLGNWHFTNVTAAAGLEFPGRYQRGAVFADINGDGAVDLLVSTLSQGVLCFVNDGHGHFKNITATAGTATPFGSVTMALADIDGNGTLDLYVANNRSEDIRNKGHVEIFSRNGQLFIPPQLQNRLVVINGVVREFGEPDVVYLNDGEGHFKLLSWTDGRFRDESGQPLKHPPMDWGQTVAFRDLDGDGSPDIYVCNDYWTPDRIWMNNGHGNFRAIPGPALRHICFSSMGIDFADINRDGFLDFFVTDMQSRDPRLRKRQVFAFNPKAPPVDPSIPFMDILPDRPQILRNTLFLNRGDDTYADIADYAGLASSDWAWQQIFLDVDLDGYEDVLVSGGYFRDVQDMDTIATINTRQRAARPSNNTTNFELTFSLEKMTNSRLFPPYELPIIAFHNLGNLRFDETTSLWGTDQPAVRQGIAVGDLDNDGCLDFVVSTFNGALGIYRNTSKASRLAVRLKGLAPNTQGIGAKVKLLNGAVPMQSQELMCGGRYLSSSEPLLMFAPGKAERSMTFEVTWRSGRFSVVKDVQPNRLYEIDENAAAPTALKSQTSPPQLLFEDKSKLLSHVHHEVPFDDFIRQPLLPRKLSQPGPGLAWYDLNQDGHEDLVIGSGQSGQLAIFLGDGKGGFQQVQNPLTTTPVSRDQTGVLAYTPAGGSPAVLAGLANYEDGQAQGAAVFQYTWATNTAAQLIPADASSSGPLAMADLDGDNDLDLFVGGRCIGGRWPEPASSRLFHCDAGKFVPDVVNNKLLEQVGLVSGAVFSDLDGDGFPELILVCEWGPIRIFHNDHGSLTVTNFPVTFRASKTLKPQPSTLNQLTGWWNAVNTGDFDGDGRLDIIASNWGLNSACQPTPEHPALVYYGDLGGLGLIDIIEAEFEPELNAIAPRRYRDPIAASLPFVSGKFPTHKAFSDATLDQVLGDARERARVAQAITLATTLFLNRGDHFEAVQLPPESQFAPAFGSVVADFNGDGAEDLFLAQNFFPVEPSSPRQDAGRGLLLLGDGNGGLRPVAGQDSGIKIYGEQRGAAAADFNEDGRVDLVVGQNGRETMLYQNATARPGLRVRLVGPPGNPHGAGALLRLKFGEKLGPARDFHAGGGYLSQDSSTVVLATPSRPGSLWVRWPGGKIGTYPIPADAHELTAEFPK